MEQIPQVLFRQLAEATVPTMRRMLSDMGMTEADISPTVALVANVEIDGVTSRVRVSVTLAPDEDEDPPAPDV